MRGNKVMIMHPLAIFMSAATLTVMEGQGQNAKTPQPSAQASTASLDRMIADGKNPRELALSIFDTHGCKKCHTIGRDGRLGFTERGKQRARPNLRRVLT